MPINIVPGEDTPLADSRPSGAAVTRQQQSSAFPISAVALSPREQGVLLLICQGLSNKRIARELQIAPETVKSHAKRILYKLSARTRAEAVARAAGLLLA